MTGLEVGTIAGFPEVAITQPHGFFDVIEPNADFRLAVFCPEFRNEEVLRRFRYALAKSLSSILGTIHGFQVQHLDSHAASKSIYLGKKHDFAVTRAGLLSTEVMNRLLSFNKQADDEFSLSFSSTDTKINPDF